MARHRHQFCQLGQQIYAATGTARDFARDFYGNFKHKLGTWDDASKVMDRYDEFD
jgi:hypothetical protein